MPGLYDRTPAKKPEDSMSTENLTIAFTVDSTPEEAFAAITNIEPKGAGAEVRFAHVGLAPGSECFDSCRLTLSPGEGP